MATRKKTTTKKKAPARKTARRPRGPAFKPTTEMKAAVSAMSSAGVPVRFIAASLNCAQSTVFKHFKQELSDGGKGTTALAIETLVADIAKGGVSGTRNARFWLRTRENALFSERRIQENVDRSAADELSKITPEEARRVAENVIKAAKQNESARASNQEPSIHDQPAGSA